jgi:hypothetical protein
MASVTGVKRGTVPATMTPVGSCRGAGVAATAAAAACPVRPVPMRAVVLGLTAVASGGPPFDCNRNATMFE